MKKLLYIALVALASCNVNSMHEVRYSSDGRDSVVFMMYFDGEQYNNAYINYPQFKTLYQEGGYDAVYDYVTTQDMPVYWMRKYAEYKRRD